MKKPSAKIDYVLGVLVIFLSGIIGSTTAGAGAIGGLFTAIVFSSGIGIIISKPFKMKQAKNYKCKILLNDEGGWECPVCNRINLNVNRCEKCKMLAILIEPKKQNKNSDDTYNIDNYKTLS